MPFIQNGRADIWYEETGQGEPVLLVHGGILDNMDGSRFWTRPGAVEALVELGYRTIVPDRRYCGGRSSAPFEAMSWDADAADLAAVLAAATGAGAHVVAGSNGCSAAARLALSEPQLVRSLVLCWPALPDNVDARDEFEEMALAIQSVGTQGYLDRLRGSGVTTPLEPFTHFPWSAALLHDERLAESFGHLAAEPAAAIVRATATDMLIDGPLRGITGDQMTALGDLRVPVAVVPPDPEDIFHPVATARDLAGRIAGSRIMAGFPVVTSGLFREARVGFATALHELFCS